MIVAADTARELNDALLPTAELNVAVPIVPAATARLYVPAVLPSTVLPKLTVRGETDDVMLLFPINARGIPAGKVRVFDPVTVMLAPR